MINLLGGDSILSLHPMEETWELVKKAFNDSSHDEFSWKVIQDRAGSRITADMEYQKPMRLKRRLLLEVNFERVSDDRILLQLHYTITPMLNIVESEKVLSETVSNIAEATSGSKQLPALTAPSAEYLEATVATRKSESRMMSGIEIVLAINVFVVFIGAINGVVVQTLNTLLAIQLLMIIPIGIFMMMYKSLGKAMTGKGYAEQSVGERLLTGSVSVVAGIFVCVAAVPIILLGLCAGFLVMYNR